MVTLSPSNLELELASEAVRERAERARGLVRECEPVSEEATELSLDIGIALPTINSPGGSPTSLGTNVCLLEFVCVREPNVVYSLEKTLACARTSFEVVRD